MVQFDPSNSMGLEKFLYMDLPDSAKQVILAVNEKIGATMRSFEKIK